MAHPKRPEAPMLALLEAALGKPRKKIKPLFPYDAQTDTLRLPRSSEDEVRRWVLTSRKVKAIKRVTDLTGAGLRVAKDYVDNLAKRR